MGKSIFLGKCPKCKHVNNAKRDKNNKRKFIYKCYNCGFEDTLSMGKPTTNSKDHGDSKL